jgi:hypothetical protein
MNTEEGTVETIRFQTMLRGERVIHVPDDVALPVGEVEICVTPMAEERNVSEGTLRTRKMLLRWADEMEKLDVDLPEDFAENHDHYIHGKPLG